VGGQSACLLGGQCRGGRWRVRTYAACRRRQPWRDWRGGQLVPWAVNLDWVGGASNTGPGPRRGGAGPGGWWGGVLRASLANMGSGRSWARPWGASGWGGGVWTSSGRGGAGVVRWVGLRGGGVADPTGLGGRLGRWMAFGRCGGGDNRVVPGRGTAQGRGRDSPSPSGIWSWAAIGRGGRRMDVRWTVVTRGGGGWGLAGLMGLLGCARQGLWARRSVWTREDCRTLGAWGQGASHCAGPGLARGVGWGGAWASGGEACGWVDGPCEGRDKRPGLGLGGGVILSFEGVRYNCAVVSSGSSGDGECDSWGWGWGGVD